MEIILKNPNDELSKPQIEQVQKEKHEYKLVGTFLRTKGLNLYAYNSIKDELKEVDVRHKDTVNLTPTAEGLIAEDAATEETQVDTRDEHFEALNWGSAQKRVKKWREGKIKELCNLRKPPKYPIGFFGKP